MKKLIVFALLWVLAIAIPLQLMAQTLSENIEAPIINLQSYFVSLGAFAAIIIPVTAFLTRVFNIQLKWLKQTLSWIVAFGVGILAWLFQWGIFTGIPWYYALFYSLCAALIANGIFSIQFTKKILLLIGLRSPKV